MRITKAIAESTAKKILAKRKENLEIYRKAAEAVILPIALSRIPKEVKDFYKKHPDYIDAYKYVRLSGNGFNYINFNLTERIPTKTSSLVVDEKEAALIREVLDIYDDAQGEIKRLEAEATTALLNLKTYKACQVNFPEAYELLPDKTCTSLTVDLTSLRQSLK